MQLGQTFSANDLPEGNDGEFTAIPAGDYQVEITEASLQDTKSGTGQYIKLRMDIIGPEYQGRVLFSNLNIRNQSEKAEQIGLQQLGDVIRAIGVPSLNDTDQLVGGNLTVKVKVKDDAEYGDANGKRNDIAAYKSLTGSKPPQANGGAPFGGGTTTTQAPAESAPQASTGAGKPPWAS